MKSVSKIQLMKMISANLCDTQGNTAQLGRMWGQLKTVGGMRWKILAVLNVQRFQIAVHLETGNRPMTNMPTTGNIFLQRDPHRHISALTAAALGCLPRANH